LKPAFSSSFSASELYIYIEVYYFLRERPTYTLDKIGKTLRVGDMLSSALHLSDGIVRALDANRSGCVRKASIVVLLLEACFLLVLLGFGAGIL